jgi:hypothetical protein
MCTALRVHCAPGASSFSGALVRRTASGVAKPGRRPTQLLDDLECASDCVVKKKKESCCFYFSVRAEGSRTSALAHLLEDLPRRFL